MTEEDRHGPTRHSSALALLRAMRPRQWTKNGVVLAAIFFAYGDQTRTAPLALQDVLRVAVGALLFCLASSAIYILNDIRDVESDRHHPVKRNRPIASGQLSPSGAWCLSVGLAASSLIGAFLLGRPFAATVTGYILLQTAYTFALKHVALLDIFIIAAGFVLRAIAGAAVISVHISPWLLLCAFLLALFLALCKRRHELVVTATGADTRRSLASYDARLLDQLIAIISASTVVAYAMYTLSPETTLKFGSAKLGFTIPFVLFGIFRYLDLAYRHEDADRPERILLTDPPILVNLLLYAGTLVTLFLWR